MIDCEEKKMEARRSRRILDGNGAENNPPVNVRIIPPGDLPKDAGVKLDMIKMESEEFTVRMLCVKGKFQVSVTYMGKREQGFFMQTVDAGVVRRLMG